MRNPVRPPHEPPRLHKLATPILLWMRQRLGRLLILGLAWAVLAVPVSLLAFANSSESTNIASHDAVVSPTFDGYATLDLGPYLPNLRYPTGYALGADVRLGKTNLSSYEALIQRYAVIGSQPEGEIAKLRAALSAMAVDSAVTGALIGLLGPAALVALGRRRREELFHHLTPAGSGTSAWPASWSPSRCSSPGAGAETSPGCRARTGSRSPTSCRTYPCPRRPRGSRSRAA